MRSKEFFMFMQRFKLVAVLLVGSTFALPSFAQNAKGLPKGAVARLGSAEWRHGDRILATPCCASSEPRASASGGVSAAR